MAPFKRDPLRDGLIAATAVAVLVACWFGVSWASAAQDDRLSHGRERDSVLHAADAALATLHTVDHRHAERDVGRWLEVTTGRLRDDLAGDRESQIDRAKSTKTVSTGSVVRSAVTELDVAGDAARVIAVLDVELTTKGEPEPQQRRVNAELRRVDGAWRISSVEAAT